MTSYRKMGGGSSMNKTSDSHVQSHTTPNQVALSHLDRVSKTFESSRERCQCRIETIKQQIRQTPRTPSMHKTLSGLVRRKHHLVGQLQKLDAASRSIDDQRLLLEDVSINEDIMSGVLELHKVIKGATLSGKKHDKRVEKMENAMESLQENKESIDEMSDVISSLGYGFGATDSSDYDDLEKLLQEEVDDLMMGGSASSVASPPPSKTLSTDDIKLPSLPSVNASRGAVESVKTAETEPVISV